VNTAKVLAHGVSPDEAELVLFADDAFSLRPRQPIGGGHDPRHHCVSGQPEEDQAMTGRKITGQAAERLRGFLAEHNVKPLSPEELAEVRANPDVDDDIEIDFEIIPPKKGRPRKGEVRAPVVGKTVKQSPAFWRALEAKAQAQGMTLHEAMREALDKWLAA